MRLAPLALCLALVLAGCNTGIGPGAQPTATATDSPMPTPAPTATATPPPDPRDVGLAADGVVEPLTLRNAHDQRLYNQSYTMERTVTVRRPNGSVVARLDHLVQTGPDRDHFVWNETRTVAPDASLWVEDLFGGARVVRAYSNATMTLAEVAITDDQRSVSRYSERYTSESPFTGPSRDFTGKETVMDTFMQVDTAVAGIDRVDGTVRYRLEAGEGPHRLRFDTPYEISTRVLGLSATVQRDGLVRRLVLRYALFHRNQTVVVRETLRITDVGSTTVERPPWADTLQAATADDADAEAIGRVGDEEALTLRVVAPATGVHPARITP